MFGTCIFEVDIFEVDIFEVAAPPVLRNLILGLF
jgi:hypothetical protein